jgi:transposase
MNRDDAEEYTQALGQVVAGGWRQVALGQRLGVPKALGLTTREWVEDRLGGYVRLALPERREAVAELTEEGLSQRQAADVLGVDDRTVGRDLAAANAAVEAPEQPRAEPAAAFAAPEPRRPTEAELVEAQRTRRLAVWVDRIHEALRTLARMAGYPIPDELLDGLTPGEVDALRAILDTLERSDVDIPA